MSPSMAYPLDCGLCRFLGRRTLARPVPRLAGAWTSATVVLQAGRCFGFATRTNAAMRIRDPCDAAAGAIWRYAYGDVVERGNGARKAPFPLAAPKSLVRQTTGRSHSRIERRVPLLRGQHHHHGAQLHALVEVDDVLVGHADAARGDRLANVFRLVGAVDAVEGVLV